MDWTAIIEKNRNALVRILGMLVTMANIDAAGFPSPLWGFDADLAIEPVARSSAEKAWEIAERSGSPAKRQASGGGDDLAIAPTLPSNDGRPPHKGEVERATLPRHLHRTILRLLRPAEAAARRLIIIAAHDVIVPPPAPPRPAAPKPASIFVRNGKGTGIVLPRGVRPSDILPGFMRPTRHSFSLPLTDPLPRWSNRRRPIIGGMPRISSPGFSTLAPVRRPPMPDDVVDATRLSLRIQAIGRVLDDLPRHARRFARWRMRALTARVQDRNRGASRLTRTWPLRPGRPPGARKRPTHEIHEVLADLQYFAFHALEQRTDSS